MSLSPGGGGAGYAYGGFAALCASAACSCRRRRREQRRAVASAHVDDRRQRLLQILRAKQVFAWGLAVLATGGSGQPPATPASAAVLSVDLVSMVAETAAAQPLLLVQWRPRAQVEAPQLVHEAWQIERKRVRRQRQSWCTPAVKQLLDRFEMEQQMQDHSPCYQGACCVHIPKRTA